MKEDQFSGLSMQGQFRPLRGKYLLSFGCLAWGTIVAVLFARWGVDAIREADYAGFAFCLGFVVFGLTAGILGITFLYFNHNAKLIVDDKTVHARVGLGREWHIPLADVTGIGFRGNDLILLCGRRSYQVYGLANSDAFVAQYDKQISEPRASDCQSVQQDIAYFKKKLRNCILLVVTLTLSLFGHIAWMAILSESEKLNELTKNLAFFGFLSAFILTSVAALCVADRYGKTMAALGLVKDRLMRIEAATRENEGLEKYRSVITVKNFGTSRIVFYAPDEKTFSSVTEFFNVKTLTWIPDKMTEMRYHSAEEMYAMLHELDEMDAMPHEPDE